MSSGDRNRRHRDDYRPGPRSRHASDRQYHDERTRGVEDRRSQFSSHDKRDQNSRHTRHSIEDTRHPPVAQPSQHTSTVTRNHVYPAEAQQPPATVAAADQTEPVIGTRQTQHGYLADSLRENRHRQADSTGYVSNRDRQQSYRQHPYHGSYQHSRGDRGQNSHRYQDESRQGRDQRSTGMMADRHNSGPGPHRHLYGSNRGQDWPVRGKGFSSNGGGFGGGGKWKHDMFEELAKESETCEANKTASVTDATPDVSAAQQDAAPSQAL